MVREDIAVAAPESAKDGLDEESRMGECRADDKGEGLYTFPDDWVGLSIG